MEEFVSSDSSKDQKTAPNIIQRSDADHSQIIGGDAVKLFGGIYPPHSPGFRHPGLILPVQLVQTANNLSHIQSHSKESGGRDTNNFELLMQKRDRAV